MPRFWLETAEPNILVKHWVGSHVYRAIRLHYQRYWRPVILARDEWACQGCGREFSSRELEAAHVTSAGRFAGYYPLEEGIRRSMRHDNLVTLCRRCHISYDNPRFPRVDVSEKERQRRARGVRQQFTITVRERGGWVRPWESHNVPDWDHPVHVPPVFSSLRAAEPERARVQIRRLATYVGTDALESATSQGVGKALAARDARRLIRAVEQQIAQMMGVRS